MALETKALQKILVLVSYIDSFHAEEIIKTPTLAIEQPHLNDVANNIQKVIENNLVGEMGLVKKDATHFVSRDREIEITLLNANVDCPQENSFGVNIRRGLCAEQERNSLNLVEFFRENRAAEFDEFIYIGHSRLGQGLALGPFVPDYTYKPHFYNSVERGRLKKIVMASCDSQRLYAYFTKENIELAGTKGSENNILDDLLPFAIAHLDSEIEFIESK